MNVLKKIEEELKHVPEDGYLATAFKGIVEDARQNIENDWALCKADYCEELQNQVDAYRDNVATLEYAKAELAAKVDKQAAVIDAIFERLEPTLKALNDYRVRYIAGRIDECNNDIIKYADTPDCREFKEAVQHRACLTIDADGADTLIRFYGKLFRGEEVE